MNNLTIPNVVFTEGSLSEKLCKHGIDVSKWPNQKESILSLLSLLNTHMLGLEESKGNLIVRRNILQLCICYSPRPIESMMLVDKSKPKSRYSIAFGFSVGSEPVEALIISIRQMFSCAESVDFDASELFTWIDDQLIDVIGCPGLKSYSVISSYGVHIPESLFDRFQEGITFNDSEIEFMWRQMDLTDVVMRAVISGEGIHPSTYKI